MKKTLFGIIVALFFVVAYTGTAYAGVITTKTGIELQKTDDPPKKETAKTEKSATKLKSKSDCTKKCAGDKKCVSKCDSKKATPKKKCCSGDKK